MPGRDIDVLFGDFYRSSSCINYIFVWGFQVSILHDQVSIVTPTISEIQKTLGHSSGFILNIHSEQTSSSFSTSCSSWLPNICFSESLKFFAFNLFSNFDSLFKIGFATSTNLYARNVSIRQLMKSERKISRSGSEGTLLTTHTKTLLFSSNIRLGHCHNFQKSLVSIITSAAVCFLWVHRPSRRNLDMFFYRHCFLLSQVIFNVSQISGKRFQQFSLLPF